MKKCRPLLDPSGAVKDGSTVLHPDLLSYKGLPVPVEKASNLFAYLKWGKGDIEAGFKQADLIVENTFTTQVTHQSYLEPHACVANTHADGSADIWSCSKTPFAVRGQLSNCIGIAKEKLVFHPDAYRRRLWRQGRIHGRGAGVLSVQEGRHAGENGHGLHRRIDRRQSAPRVDY